MTLRLGIGHGSVTVASNNPPNTPTCTASSIGATTVTLTSSAFDDGDPGDTHTRSQWQITTSGDTSYSSPVVNTGDSTSLTQYFASGLTAETAYIARVRHKDSQDAYSDWSANEDFTTIAQSAVQPVFEDDFESGNFTSPTGGSWSTKNATVVTTSGANGVAAPTPVSGSYCVQTRWPGSASGGDSQAFINSTLDNQIPASGGMWVEAYIFFPNGNESTYVGPQVYHRVQGGSGSSTWKLHRAYAAPYIDGPSIGPDMGYEPPDGDGGSDCGITFRDQNGTHWGTWKIAGYHPRFKALGGVTSSPYDGQIPRGEWVRFRWHYKISTGLGNYDGVFKMWVNDTQVYNLTALLAADNKDFWYKSGKDYWDTFYVFEYNNAGFAVDTFIYVDAVKAYNQNPGW